MNKGTYVNSPLVGTHADAHLLEAALIYWHSGIPLEAAKVYFKNLENKINGSRNRLPVKTQEAS